MFLRLFGLLVVSLATVAAADVRIVEEIVAKVNNDIITRTELERTRQNLEAELKQQGLSGQKLREAVEQRQQDALRDQIDQLLLVQKGKDLNINVDPEITRRMAEIQLQSKIVDPDKFHEFVREQTGMSYEDFRQQMKNQLLTQRVVGQEIGSRINIPDAEKRKYYEAHKSEFVREEQVFLRQVLISTEGKSPEQVAAADKKAKDLVTRARKGEKFADLARDNSDDTETAKNGGELPPFKRKDHLLRPEIEDIVFKAKRGYITDPIRLRNGFLILKVEERFEAGQASYEEVESQISEQLTMPQMQPKVRAFLTKLRQDAFLEIRGGFMDSGAAPGKDTSWKDPAQLKPETVTKEEVASRRKRKLLWIIPAGHKKVKPETAPAPTQPAAAAAAPATPAAPAAAPTPTK